jgi:hypothetical protein
MDYQDLQKQVENYNSHIKERRRENYRYAKDKGFTTKEAMILAGKNKEEIDRLAQERDGGNGNG